MRIAARSVANTDPVNNFLGTTDAKDFVLRTNNTERARMTADGYALFGTASAYDTSRVQVNGGILSRNGPVKVSDASYGATYFIGNDTATMMAEETFAEFEARMHSGEHEAPEDGSSDRPLDRDGVAWDYVTPEGLGFNDVDDEGAMTFEKSGKSVPVFCDKHLSYDRAKAAKMVATAAKLN